MAGTAWIPGNVGRAPQTQEKWAPTNLPADWYTGPKVDSTPPVASSKPKYAGVSQAEINAQLNAQYGPSGAGPAPAPTPAPAPAAPAPAPAAAAPQPQPQPAAGPAMQALERIDAGTGWEYPATPSVTRPGLGERLMGGRPPVFTSGRIY